MDLIYVSCLDGFEQKYPYGLQSVVSYAEKYGIHTIIRKHRSPVISKDVNGSWYPWFDPDLLSQDWNRICILDADIIPSPEAPNIFEQEAKYGVILDSAPVWYGGEHHLKQWKYFGFQCNMPPELYYNGGVILAEREYYECVRNQLADYFLFWFHNQQNVNAWEQTPINMIAWNKFRKDITYLSVQYNDMIMFNYKDMSFIDSPNFWHFTGPNMGGTNNRAELMSATWQLVEDKYV